MQQTETYKLNLIEKTDTFSPDALNENTRKVEEVLAGEEAARKQKDAYLEGKTDGLDARVTALEVHKIAVGHYSGNGKPMTIKLGFTPVAVLIRHRNPTNGLGALAVTGFPAWPAGGKTPTGVVIVDGGFTIDDHGGVGYDNPEMQYQYIAFA